jgi:hypothetical protein
LVGDKQLSLSFTLSVGTLSAPDLFYLRCSIKPDRPLQNLGLDELESECKSHFIERMKL